MSFLALKPSTALKEGFFQHRAPCPEFGPGEGALIFRKKTQSRAHARGAGGGKTVIFSSLQGGAMKVLLVDDHALFREGVRLLLERLGDEFEILEAGDCAGALELAEQTPDLGLVLLDLALPDKPGFEALSMMRERYPGVPVVVVSGSEDRPSVIEAINRGAMGYIPKSSNSTLLKSALQLVFAKGVYIPPSVLTDRPNIAATASTEVKQKDSKALRELGVTDRQIEVLGLLVQGLPNKLIARKLNLSEPTVKAHVSGALRALNVSNRTQAVLAVGQMGITFK
jgi:DNA-binding NarL/FixJ family response regulator